MENLKGTFISLSSLLGFINSKIDNGLKNIELLINTDESSIQPIDLKSQSGLPHSIHNSLQSKAPEKKTRSGPLPSFISLIAGLSAKVGVNRSSENRVSTEVGKGSSELLHMDSIVDSRTKAVEVERSFAELFSYALVTDTAVGPFCPGLPKLQLPYNSFPVSPGTGNMCLMPGTTETHVDGGINNGAANNGAASIQSMSPAGVHSILRNSVDGILRCSTPTQRQFNSPASIESTNLFFASSRFPSPYSHLSNSTSPFAPDYSGSRYTLPEPSVNSNVDHQQYIRQTDLRPLQSTHCAIQQPKSSKVEIGFENQIQRSRCFDQQSAMPLINLHDDSDTTGTGNMLPVFPGTSQTQADGGMNNAAASYSSIQNRNPAAAVGPFCSSLPKPQLQYNSVAVSPVKRIRHQCNDCSRSYASQKALRAHRKKAHDIAKLTCKTPVIKPYLCEVCLKAYTVNESLQRHQKKDHGIFKFAYKAEYEKALEAVLDAKFTKYCPFHKDSPVKVSREDMVRHWQESPHNFELYLYGNKAAWQKQFEEREQGAASCKQTEKLPTTSTEMKHFSPCLIPDCLTLFANSDAHNQHASRSFEQRNPDVGKVQISM